MTTKKNKKIRLNTLLANVGFIKKVQKISKSLFWSQKILLILPVSQGSEGFPALNEKNYANKDFHFNIQPFLSFTI